ncbi:DNA-formamidopyrimidine glycosylase family protein [Chryseolinea sp. H1M3-3]|uniref:DNA-formamidopyrimidine glycosylase family protein n=1 Tax=Chryseolinea sp. H1M3-3 TaxID=3034144 RepID=UPI0023EDBE78|nr:DNA-formamidopyrimidine glycosylase family protein [Chryseolinea sp. H1M3-3]
MEGPSLVILKEQLQPFKGKKIRKASGSTTRVETNKLVNQKIIDFKSWGKHFLIEFETFFLRIHFLMFGSYRINEQKEAKPRLHFEFTKGELNFYTCSVIRIDESVNDVYDWSADVMNDQWDPAKARKKIKKFPLATVSDILLDQNIFAGVGNIIKNEVLFRIRVHPETTVQALPPRKLTSLITEARNYSFDFYEWKKIFQLRKHWLIYTKRKCPSCKGPVIKRYTGITKRRSFFCEKCQQRYE